MNGFALELVTGPKVETPSGWQQTTQVSHAGLEIGTVRYQRRNGRTRVLSIVDGVGVKGRDLQWIVREAGITGISPEAA